MTDLVVIVPSRGRPDAAAEMAQSFRETCSGDTHLLFAVDASDPARDEYNLRLGGARTETSVRVDDSNNMGEALHLAATYVTDDPMPGLPYSVPFAVGFAGDDHRPRTQGWDKAYLDALREMGTGIVYGNDLLQGENIPTQVAMTSDIIRALGYMAPPTLVHLYFDNFWKVLGNGAGCLKYLPDVIVEHMHPVAGKAEWDDNYRRVNSTAMYEHDSAAFDEWLRKSMVEDVAKVRALRGAA